MISARWATRWRSADDEHFSTCAGRTAAARPVVRSASSDPEPGLASRMSGARAGGYRVQATEGGHIDFAPLDSIEDAFLARLRPRIAAFRPNASCRGRG
jgi:glucokinase